MNRISAFLFGGGVAEKGKRIDASGTRLLGGVEEGRLGPFGRPVPTRGGGGMKEIVPQGYFLALRAQGATSLRSSQ